VSEAAVAVAAAPALVGREAERDHLDAFVAAVPHGARALLIRGAPGIGKTSLWRFALERCRQAGFQVLLTRPAEEEMSLPLAGLADLFEHVELGAVDVASPEDPFTRGRAVLAALRQLAASGPVVLALDDLQWLDSASARSLRYALRRLDAEPVGVLGASRVGSDPEDPLACGRSLPPGRCGSLDLGPVDLKTLRAILRGVVAAISHPLLARIHEISEGNPFYAIELARGLPGDARSRLSASELRLPDSLQAAVARRLESVPAGLGELLDLAAVAGPVTVRELGDALPGADLPDLLATAQRDGLLVVDEQLEVRFAHPVIASTAYGRMSPLTRRSLHGRLAAGARDPDVRARHLALSTDDPDGAVADLLEDAARRASDRSAPDLAAELAGHSVRLTPAEDAEGARRRALAEIEHLAAAGQVGRAIELADRLVDSLPAGSARGEVLLQRYQLVDDPTPASEALLLRALDDAGDDDRLRSRALRELAGLRGWELGDMQGALGPAREALALAERMRDPGTQMLAAAGLAHLEAVAGSPRPDLMDRAAALEQELGSPSILIGPGALRTKQLYWAGELGEAQARFEALLAHAVRSGNEFRRPYCLYDLALVECAAGDLAEAKRHVDEGLEAARDAEDAYTEGWLLYPLALVEAWLGRPAEARAAADRLLARALHQGNRPGVVRARGVLGLLALSAGAAGDAARELTEAVQLLGDMGYANPGAFPVLPNAVEALALTGDVERARALLERLEGEAAATRSAWATAAAERSRGVLFLAGGDAEAALAPLQNADEELGRLGHRPDAARAALARGRALLRLGQRSLAAETLADSRARFAGMGAALWEARAAEELERAAPGRAAGELTAAEQRVAALVAEGLKNREIGQTLFMSVATVEAHLTRIYRKLGIRSRSELVRAMSDGATARHELSAKKSGPGAHV
jgi:DNA-binding CsgD family transcriptional regulator